MTCGGLVRLRLRYGGDELGVEGIIVLNQAVNNYCTALLNHERM